MAWFTPKKREPNSPWPWLLLYICGVGIAVWGTMLVHWAMGEDIFYPLIAWMPYCFTNHAAMLITAMMAAICVGKSNADQDESSAKMRGIGALGLLAVLSFETIKPALALVLSEDFYERYCTQGTASMLLLVGYTAALMRHQIPTERSFRRAWTGTGALCLIPVALTHQFGTFCVLVGFAVAWCLSTLLDRDETSSFRERFDSLSQPILCGAGVFVLGALMFTEFASRATLPRTDFDRTVEQRLNELGSEHAMVASYPNTHMLQPRINHPVFMDTSIPSCVVYTPQVAPAVQKIYTDLYGIRFYPPMKGGEPTWTEVWQSRSRQDWQNFSDRYSVEYLISPNDVPLDALEVIFAGEHDTIYQIR